MIPAVHCSPDVQRNKLLDQSTDEVCWFQSYLHSREYLVGRLISLDVKQTTENAYEMSSARLQLRLIDVFRWYLWPQDNPCYLVTPSFRSPKWYVSACAQQALALAPCRPSRAPVPRPL
jgi:hypothetical protein